MTTLLQISDPHFGTERPAVVEALVALVHAQAPALVVLSGDITQRATNAEFDAAAAFVRRLAPYALLTVPGNHDIPLFAVALRAFAPYRRYVRVFGRAGVDAPVTHDVPGWHVVGVNTTRRWRHKNGELSRRQIDAVARALRAARPGQLRVVVVHHPVAVTRKADRDNLLPAREAAVRAWAAAGADLVMGGHIHLPYVLPLHEADAALTRRVWTVQAGTAVSDRVRHDAGNSVNLCHRDDDGRVCRVERWDYSADAGAFEPVGTHRLECSPR